MFFVSLKIIIMKTIKNLKLNEVSSSELKKRELNLLKGGNFCSCMCSPDDMAQVSDGAVDQGGCSCNCSCIMPDFFDLGLYGRQVSASYSGY